MRAPACWWRPHHRQSSRRALFGNIMPIMTGAPKSPPHSAHPRTTSSAGAQGWPLEKNRRGCPQRSPPAKWWEVLHRRRAVRVRRLRHGANRTRYPRRRLRVGLATHRLPRQGASPQRSLGQLPVAHQQSHALARGRLWRPARQSRRSLRSRAAAMATSRRSPRSRPMERARPGRQTPLH